MRPGRNDERSPRRTASAVVLILSAVALAGCARAGAEPSAVHIGAVGSACEMPVTFGLAESYLPKAVTVAPDDPLAELARRGPLTMVCEIDAKPAGAIGYLRVWTAGKADLRPSLETFIGTRVSEPVFTELRLAGRPALEVAYRQKSEVDDAMDRERALAVETAQGIAVIALDSLDSEEHDAMLPAYELAKTTLTLTT